MNKYLIKFPGNQTTAAEGMEAGLAEMDGKGGCDKRKGRAQPVFVQPTPVFLPGESQGRGSLVGKAALGALFA